MELVKEKYFQIPGDQMYTLNTEDFSSYPIPIRLIQAHTGLRKMRDFFHKTSTVFIKIFQDLDKKY